METKKRPRSPKDLTAVCAAVAAVAGPSPTPPPQNKPVVPKPLVVVPHGLLDAALIDAETCAAVGSVSLSWWLAEVAAGIAPQPVVRRTRLTRWSLQAVRTFWLEFARGTDGSEDAAKVVLDRATQASAKAKLKRDAAKALAAAE